MRIPHRPSLALVATTTLAAVAAPAVFAHGDHGKGHHGPAGTTPVLPTTIALPNGFQPEGVASDGRRLFVGSIPTGAIYRADPKTGQGTVLVPPHDGRAAIGVKVSGKKLVVAGGTTGHAFFYDARTGADLADVTLTTGNAFINDVAIGNGAAWFTDSRQPQLYKVGLGHRHGGWGDDSRGGKRDDHRGGGGEGRSAKRLGGSHGHGHDGNDDVVPTSPTASPTATTIPITGAMQYDDDPATNEANGIVAFGHGKQLLVIQSRTGQLFRIDGKTGVSVEVPITGGPLTNGDGLLLVGKTLFVVQNRLNQIAVVKLARDLSGGEVKQTITSPLFRVPTTLALARTGLYAVNARFGTPATPTTDYDVVKVPLTK